MASDGATAFGGYTKVGGGAAWRPNRNTLPHRGTSAGGGYSTVEDLPRFADAFENPQLLDNRHTELLTTGKVNTGNRQVCLRFHGPNREPSARLRPPWRSFGA